MKERGIIFNTEMVKAILDERKTVTRRPVKRQPDDHHWSVFDSYKLKCHHLMANHYRFEHSFDERQGINGSEYDGPVFCCPFGQIGDKLYVRETFFYGTVRNDGDYEHPMSDYICQDKQDLDCVIYYTDAVDRGLLDDLDKYDMPKMTPSIHMPKWAARIWLEITDIRVERVQVITEEQIKVEGIKPHGLTIAIAESKEDYPPKKHGKDYTIYHAMFENLWNSVYNNWSENPWVWVIEFKVVDHAKMPTIQQ